MRVQNLKSNIIGKPLDIDFHYMMDAEWVMRCVNNLNILIIDEIYLIFRISNSNNTSDQILKAINNS